MMSTPSFRLNAPQAEESQIEFESSFGLDTSARRRGSETSNQKPSSFRPKLEAPALSQEDIQRLAATDPRFAALLAQQQEFMTQWQIQQEREQEERNLQASYVGPFPVKCLITIGSLVICLLVGLIIIFAITLGRNATVPVPQAVDGAAIPTAAPINAPLIPTTPVALPTVTRPTLQQPQQDGELSIPEFPTPAPASTLGRIFQRGFLKCGVAKGGHPGFAAINVETGNYEGFDVDLCRAVAAGIFGDANEGRVQYVETGAFERFFELEKDSFDVLARATSHTMEREVFEVLTEKSFQFSIPYLYNGLMFAGVPPYVKCADDRNVTSPECASMTICVLDGTTHVAQLKEDIPGASVIQVVRSEDIYTRFISGACNVIAGESHDIAEFLVRERGYDGAYEYGATIHSKEPLAMATRGDDPEWGDFVNWIVQALLTAEDLSITSATASAMRQSNVFGDRFQNVYRNAVAAVGNYEEMYSRNLESLVARSAQDMINDGSTGLIYAMPFGVVDGLGSEPVEGGILDQIRQRGFLRCGISRRLIFAQQNEATDDWEGFDVDFCKAISAAIFEGQTESVQYVDLAASDRFQDLQDGDVDVLSRITTATLERDVKEPSTQVGFSFSQPTFYDGLTFGGLPQFTRCADDLDITSVDCRNLLICVNEATTFEAILREIFPERFLVPRQSSEMTAEGLKEGVCNTIAGGVVDVSPTSIRTAGYDGPYTTGSNRFSRDPLALVTRQDDVQFSSFVYWIVSAIFFAEEEDISRTTAEQLPQIGLFGQDFLNMFQLAVSAVGNYGDIYERHAEAEVPRGGLNLLNKNLAGRQHYPLPGVE